ncbi:conserved hypothetical protein [Formosa agariphila KMM 3901]|uniref:Uncharacterized protein n=1 Tax=Formosa agariphila (strain DSM 15362 / KCTC 12365 / LMG 23005 / KMM 3901 / M-2Alg 35-1) TaxID=1347342 RepID=T2KM71_FORAG|nr:hypothetical protein [Formosa agariphila]CDF79104.1 conserved hypothetical protein [Formosa agariphila KMM 3901]
MNHLKTYIVFKVFTIVLVLAFLAPTFVKFNHVFETHLHEVCHGEKKAHLHTADIDCEFYKFQLNHHFTIPVFTAEILDVKENHSLISTQYFFLNTFQQLHFSLRAPPTII